MTLVIELLSGLCLLFGSVLCVTGGVGLFRMPDFYSRVHASGLTETLAIRLAAYDYMMNDTLEDVTGALVTQIQPRSAAERAGIERVRQFEYRRALHRVPHDRRAGAAGLRDGADRVKLDAAGGFERDAARDPLDGAAHLVDVHVVEHNPVWTQGDRFFQLVPGGGWAIVAIFFQHIGAIV